MDTSLKVNDHTLPVGFEVEAIEGERYVWLAPNVVNRLRAMRGPRESYSD